MICFCGLFAKEALEMDAVELTRELIKIESTDPWVGKPRLVNISATI